MTAGADRLLVNAEVHTLADPDETADAVAIRNGEIVAVGDEYELEFLADVETDVIDCEGRVVVPGFVDAHTHMESVGQYQVHADLSDAERREDCVDRLADRDAETDDGWVLGFGYDESEWDDARYLRREDLDRVSEDRPVAAMRVDMHTASLNSVALERLREALPSSDVEREGGEPTGVVVEAATEVLRDAIDPDREATRDLLVAAQDYAVERGVTTVHDMVRNSHAPRVYRDLEADGDLALRVRLNYWSDHLESVSDVGLATNAGSEFVRVGAIKSFSDGSIGGRTAKLFEPYEDEPGEVEGERTTPGTSDAGDGDETDRGQWVVDPEELRAIVDDADREGLQLAIHAIGDEAIEETLSALETRSDPDDRHRIEHLELATDDQLRRMAEAGIVASMQPNFHQWAAEDGLYDRRLGEQRRRRSNRLRAVHDAGVPVAFGSDCMPLDPLLGVHHAVNAPDEAQRLSVTEAMRAYTTGGAYAGFDEDRLGTIAAGKRADLVVLETSPWDDPEAIEEIDVATTIVDGDIVSDDR